MVPMNNKSPAIATPRLTRPQQGRASAAGVYVYFQKTRPEAASSAMMVFGASTVYMIPSTTSGVASNFSSDRT